MPTGVIVMFASIGFSIFILVLFGRGKRGK